MFYITQKEKIWGNKNLPQYCNELDIHILMFICLNLMMNLDLSHQQLLNLLLEG